MSVLANSQNGIGSITADFQFSGRVYLRTRQLTGFLFNYGPYYFQIAQALPSDLSALSDNIRGFVITSPCEVEQLSLIYQPSSNSPGVAWITRLVKRAADGTMTAYDTPEPQPQTTSKRSVTFNFDNVFYEPGDLLSVIFERTSETGESTYYLYLDASIKVRSRS